MMFEWLLAENWEDIKKDRYLELCDELAKAKAHELRMRQAEDIMAERMKNVLMKSVEASETVRRLEDELKALR